MGNLTPAEKAALYLHVLEDVNDWKELYKIAVGEYKFNLLADNTKNKYVTTWKNSPRIKKGVDEIKIYFHAKIQEIKQNAIFILFFCINVLLHHWCQCCHISFTYPLLKFQPASMHQQSWQRN